MTRRTCVAHKMAKENENELYTMYKAQQQQNQKKKLVLTVLHDAF